MQEEWDKWPQFQVLEACENLKLKLLPEELIESSELKANYGLLSVD